MAPTAPPAASAPPPAPASPEYEPEEARPDYEPPAAVSTPVENEAIVAPQADAPPPRHHHHLHQASAAAAPVELPAEDPEPAPAESPEPLAAAPSTGDRAGGLRGRSTYAVEEGDCLWAIAEGVLGGGATNAAISAEVARLWHLNSAAIGTGDPNVILVGTILRLH
ncbi:MAG TPA: hypothetical protein VHZ54_02170 [Solirubrobacterales bacterium]|nr:hypothetical protein [Solirubrobacterales bacterium]